jgi:hypothetical protein
MDQRHDNEPEQGGRQEPDAEIHDRLNHGAPPMRAEKGSIEKPCLISGRNASAAREPC